MLADWEKLLATQINKKDKSWRDTGVLTCGPKCQTWSAEVASSCGNQHYVLRVFDESQSYRIQLSLHPPFGLGVKVIGTS